MAESASSLGYRHVHKEFGSSSEESDNSDSDNDVTWKRKKMVKESSMETSSTFQNPLLQKKQEAAVSGEAGLIPRKKVNNIWGNVLQEQTLTQELGGHVMDAFERTRDVESYDFKKYTSEKYHSGSSSSGSESDTDKDKIRSDKSDKSDKEVDMDDGDHYNKRKSRKRGVKDRLGERDIRDRLRRGDARDGLNKKNNKGNPKERLGQKPKTYKSDNYIDVTIEDSKEKIVCALSENLSEPKIEVLSKLKENI